MDITMSTNATMEDIAEVMWAMAGTWSWISMDAPGKR
jgi:hypothetical protein